jgi:hypothetical protein
MQFAHPPRLVRGDFPHLCPGEGCAVCAWLAGHRDSRHRSQWPIFETQRGTGALIDAINSSRDVGVLAPGTRAVSQTGDRPFRHRFRLDQLESERDR